MVAQSSFEFEKALLGHCKKPETAYLIRYSTTKFLQVYALGVAIAYYSMYHGNDWEQNKVSNEGKNRNHVDLAVW